MSAPQDPRHAAPSGPPVAPSTQEIPVVPAEPAEQPPVPAAGATRAGSLPAPGQLPPQHASSPHASSENPPPPPVPPPAAPAPAWPDTLTDEPSPPTRPAPAAEGFAPTGPVDFVPGLPGAGSAEPPPRRRLRVPGAATDRRTLVAVGLAALAVVLLQLGLTRDDADLWSTVTLWAAFATAATVLGLVALAARAAAPARVPARVATQVVGAAVVALAIFWLLVVLPIVASDPGFLVTAALLALGAALWIGPGRER
jgi:hypothetical protein